MSQPDSELIWQGRLHLGDGPGVYGDAPYVGLGLELPLTLRRFPDTDGSSVASIIIETEGLQPRGGLPGPTVSVVRYAPGNTQGHWHEHLLREERLDEQVTTVAIDLSREAPDTDPLPLGIRLRINTDAPPGLYADFVLVALRIDSATHYASLGFQSLA